MKWLRELSMRSNRKNSCGMRVARGLCFKGAFLLFCLSCHGQAKHNIPKIDVDSPISQPKSPTTRACSKRDYELLSSSEAARLLSDYGFDGFIPGRCVAVDLGWLHSAQIVRITAVTATVDDNREITLLRASPDSRLWLIPIENGMVGYLGTPSNPHNLAAFNDLLRVAALRVTDNNVQAISDVYQFIVGMEVKSNPHPPKTVKEAMSTNDIAGFVDHEKGTMDFTHREAFGDSWNSNYMVWEFTYKTLEKFTELKDVERMTLKQYEDTR